MYDIIVLDYGKGGINFIKYFKKEEDINMSLYNIKYLKLFNIVQINNFRDYLLSNIKYYTNNNKLIIIDCHSASSYILDLLIKNNFIYKKSIIYEPIYPICKYILNKKFKRILILSTLITKKFKWHQKLLRRFCDKIEYIGFSKLHLDIQDDNNKEIYKSLKLLNSKKQFIKKSDCIVLGCTDYNIIKDLISTLLIENYNFKGVVLDSNLILLNYIKYLSNL